MSVAVAMEATMAMPGNAYGYQAMAMETTMIIANGNGIDDGNGNAFSTTRFSYKAEKLCTLTSHAMRLLIRNRSSY